MGDAFGQGAQAGAGVIKEFQAGERDWENKAQVQFENNIKKQQLFNQAVQVDIEDRKQKLDWVRMGGDPSQLDLMRFQMTAPELLGAQGMNQQAASGPPPIDMTPTWNPSGTVMSPEGIYTKQQEDLMDLRRAQAKQQSDPARLFLSRQYSQDLRSKESQINSLIRQGLGQEFANINQWGSTNFYDKVKKSGKQEIQNALDEYHMLLETGFTSDDPITQSVARQKNQKYFKEWQQREKLRTAPGTKIEEFQNDQMTEPPMPDETSEAPASDQQTNNFNKFKDIAAQYVGGTKIKGLPTKYSERALSDKLSELVQKKFITKSQAAQVLSEAKALNQERVAELPANIQLYKDTHSVSDPMGLKRKSTNRAQR